ncbi:MAG TPA: glycosyltransferase, partial [Chitinophagales bacterium]|nr:glycosyltransferase [Chitinophagales bacterium]
ARDEEENIQRCLESLRQQLYPKELLDVIVVNDHSTDSTLAIAQAFATKHGFKVIDLKDHVPPATDIRSYKKLAIETAVRSTEASVIVTLDADCTVDLTWLMTLVAALKKSGDVCVLGPVMIEASNDFFSQIQALDVASLTGVAAATAGWDKPLVANGANMCFTRKAYLDVNGLVESQRVTSGDDMFLLQKFVKAFPNKITYCKSPEAVVYTKASPDFVSFFNQRLRWASKSGRFKDVRTLAVVMFVYFFDVLLLVNAAMAVNSKWHFNVFLGQLLVKCFADIFFLKDVVTFFNRRHLLDLFLPTQLFRLVYVVLTGFGAWFVPVKWKGRKVFR